MTGRAAKNFFDFTCKSILGKNVDFSKYKGRVILVENIASLCSTTVRNFTQMNELHAKFGDKIKILPFPCNQFGYQENANGEEIYNSLKYVRPGKMYKTTYALMEKCNVNGSETHPVFSFLRQSLPAPSDEPYELTANPKLISWKPVSRTDIGWNFEKFLIAPDGIPYKRYSQHYETINLQSDIQDLIEKYKI